MARVWVLSATLGQCRQLEEKLAPFFAPVEWFPQRYQPATQQTILNLKQDAAWLASELARIGVVYEIEGENEIFLHHPGLGVHRLELDEAGEPTIRFGQIDQLLAKANGSMQEFLRLKRLAQGQPWLDLLEPYRMGLQRLEMLPRAI